MGRGGRCGDADHLADAGAEECFSGSGQGGTGGDHVVDQQHLQPLAHRTGAELGRLQALGPRVPRLRLAVAAELMAISAT